jgi:hypothetical protein
VRKRRKFIFAILCFAAVVAIVTLSVGEREPAYKGRSLHEWAEMYGSPETYGAGAEDEARTALQHIGTNAIPFLLNWIAYDARPSRARLIGMKIVSHVPLIRNVPTVKNWLHRDDPRLRRAEAAAGVFELLGPSAASAVPELSRLAALSTDPGPARRALDALVGIGPLAFPAVLGIVTNSQADACFYAIATMEAFGTNARPAIPVLLSYLTNKDLVGVAGETLGHLKSEAGTIVCGITNMLPQAQPLFQQWMIMTLTDLGPDARGAIPALVSTLSSTNAGVRKEAAAAIEAIGQGNGKR